MTINKHKKYWIWISRLPNIGPKTIKKLLDKYNSLEKIFYKSKESLIDNDISPKIAETITDTRYKENLDKYITYMEKEKINIITIEDEEYPYKLRKIENFPLYLYFKGNIELLNKKSIAIVGTRNCTSYGKNMSKHLANSISNNNIVIVSGLARGIDTYAHIGALKNKESTIAVLGCGIDTIYPKENEILANEILNKNGLIISEYIMGSKIEKNNFPARNRIISGISDGVLVIEAPERSGALITVDFALEQGKEVFAVPGNINSFYSRGTNNLIKDGAQLVQHAQDVLQIL